MSITDWINAISSILMVLITVVYVSATICISRSNKESLEASRKQLRESQKQQKQNAELQLYGFRKDAINKVAQKQYDEVYFEIPLLFNEKLSAEFQGIASKAKTTKELQESIDRFETEFGVLAGLNASNHVKHTREKCVSIDDLRELKESIIQILNNKGINTESFSSVDVYIDQVKYAKDLERQCEAESALLNLHLSEFVKESIK